MKNILYILVLCSVALNYSCKKNPSAKTNQKEKPPIAVDVIIASYSDFASNIEVIGSVLSEEMIELHPEVGGRIIYLNMPDGAKVSTGSILAKVNDADLQAQLQQQKVQLELAQKTEQRLAKLLSINGVDQATYDAAISQVNLYNAAINVLNAQIEKTVIKAPFSGTLGLRQISLGAFVSTSTVIGTLQQSDRIKIDFSVPETYSGLILKGKTVSIVTNESKQELYATINAIEPQINTTSRSLKVRAYLNQGSIRPGSFVKVLLNEKTNGILVPSNSIIPDALSNQVVVVKNGQAIFKNVETGIKTNNSVQITEGLQIGDTVIVSGMMYVRPKADVKIKKVRN